LTTQAPKIIDATLREGAQAPGVRFGLRESIEIARTLRTLGVDMIECGHPRVGQLEQRRVREVVAASDEIPVLAHARARVEDIDAVAATGARWVGIFIGVNPISTNRLGAHKSVHQLIHDAVVHARGLGLGVRFTVEDGSRTEWDELVAAYRVALDAGADRICFADTVGVLAPWNVQAAIERLSRSVPGVDLEVHFHDDRGMADSNAMVAARAGAGWVSSAVNGIGERCGITDTITLLANLHVEGWRTLPDGVNLPRASEVVEAHSRTYVDFRRPVVGRNAFTHTAKLHREAVSRDERTYSWTTPESLGRTTSLSAATLPLMTAEFANTPTVISATELRHHRHGPGDRYVMIDDRVVSDARQYCIVRRIPAMADHGPGHVDQHRHRVDSLFMFIGDEEGLTGLTVTVTLGDESFTIESPKSVFIPAGIMHSYRVVGGAGLFVNHVLAGSYNASLLDETTDPSMEDSAAAAARAFLAEFLASRRPGIPTTPDTQIVDIFDSLLLIDFFIRIENRVGASVMLDELAVCRTLGEIAQLLIASWPKQESQCAASPV
jgi:2-isopropylmalate synthase